MQQANAQPTQTAPTTMAKKNATPEAPNAAPPTTPDAPVEGAKEKKAPGRPKGFSTKDGDIFTAVIPQPEGVKIAPQAQGIVNLVIAAGKDGISRKALVEQMEGVVTTRQPQGRILSYYQKLISADKGLVTITDAPAAAKPAETATASA